jgi:hypothetical protein
MKAADLLEIGCKVGTYFPKCKPIPPSKRLK